MAEKKQSKPKGAAKPKEAKSKKDKGADASAEKKAGSTAKATSSGAEVPRLQRYYEERVRPRLMEKYGFKNPYQVPRVEKVVINVGLGEAAKNAKLLDSIVDELTLITGQKPVVTRARKSIANFGIREGMPIGAMVTLRRQRMYEFLDRLINVSVPRVRDFRGLSTRAFDGRGNYTIGVKEQMIFPEIDYDKVQKMHGMDIVVVTNTNKDDEALALLRELGFPFRGEQPVLISDWEHAA